MAGNFKLGFDFPSEGFVQLAIEKFFANEGFQVVELRHADFCCLNPATGQKWIVEAKGKTTAIGLDFRTGIGQLIQRMEDETANYAIAVPSLPQFHTQIKNIPYRVRMLLNLHILLVAQDGNVLVVNPQEVLE